VGRRKWFVLVLAALLLAALVVALLVFWKSSREEIIACANYDSQVWAQSVYETNPIRYADLDPDGNGLACEDLPLGAAPAEWANEVPRAAELASLTSVSDGDTIRVDVGGQVETLRLILIDTPETDDPNNPPECYGAEATAVLERRRSDVDARRVRPCIEVVADVAWVGLLVGPDRLTQSPEVLRGPFAPCHALRQVKTLYHIVSLRPDRER
jgi:hypothetical protein